MNVTVSAVIVAQWPSLALIVVISLGRLGSLRECALGVFIFRVTFGTEMQGRQKVAKFCKIFKNNF